MSNSRGSLDGTSIDVPCPECGRSLSVTVGEARRSPTIECPGGHRVHLEASQFDSGIRDAERSVDDFKRHFK